MVFDAYLHQRNATLARLIAQPAPLPTRFDAAQQQREYEEALIQNYLADFLPDKYNGFFPSSLKLAHYLHIPPEPERTRFNFPIIVRREGQSGHLAAFGHFRRFRELRLSLVERVSRKREDSWIFVFASRSFNSRVDKSVCKQANVVLKPPVKPLDYAPSIFDEVEPKQIREDWLLYSHVDLDSILQRLQKGAPSIAYPTGVQFEFGGEQDDKVLRYIFPNSFELYLERLSYMVAEGYVIFCIPQVYEYKALGIPRAQVGGGACAFIVGEEPTVDELEALFLASTELCSSASAVHDLGRITSLHMFRTMFQAMTHSIGNAIREEIQVNSTPTQVARILAIQELHLRALESFARVWEPIPSSLLPWGESGYRGESISSTIQHAYSSAGHRIEVDDSPVRGARVDGRLVLIVTELARNLFKNWDDVPTSYRRELEQIVISESPVGESTVDVNVVSVCDYEAAWHIQKKLLAEDGAGGITLIAYLAGGMADEASRIEWCLRPLRSDFALDEYATRMANCYLHAPPELVDDNPVLEEEVFEMTFSARGLHAFGRGR